MPPKYPSIRRGRDGIPVLYDSDAARQFKERAWFPPQTASQVENLAKECVRERGGDVNDRKDVLGEFVLQSGKYRGQKFCWLLENCPGYVGWFVGSILEDRVKGDKSSVTQMANKDSLLMYCSMFEESRAIVSQKLSGRSKKIQDEWKRLCEKRNVVPGQQFHLLLSGRELSPEALRRKVKDRKNKPSYLKILPSPNPAVSFQLVTGPWNTAVLVPSSVPPASVPSTSQGGMKRKGEEVRTAATEAKKLKRCSKCGEERTPPGHQHYMGYRYSSSVDNTPFTEWREQLKNAGVARKKKGN